MSFESPLYQQSALSLVHTLMKSAERSIVAYINEHEKVVEIDSNIYSQGEDSDSPECF